MKEMLVVSIVAIAVIFSCSVPYVTSESVVFTVTDKERIVESGSKNVTSKYLVFTEGETFENTDCFVRFKFDSSDLQGSLKPGSKYRAMVYGWRIPFLSSYRNIISAKKIQ